MLLLLLLGGGCYLLPPVGLAVGHSAVLPLRWCCCCTKRAADGESSFLAAAAVAAAAQHLPVVAAGYTPQAVGTKQGGQKPAAVAQGFAWRLPVRLSPQAVAGRGAAPQLQKEPAAAAVPDVAVAAAGCYIVAAVWRRTGVAVAAAVFVHAAAAVAAAVWIVLGVSSCPAAAAAS